MNAKMLKKYLSLGLIAVVLFMVFILLEKNNYVLKLDYSDDLSTKSIAIIQSLLAKDSIKFEVYSNENSLIAKKIAKFLLKFHQLNNKIKIEFIDPVSNPSRIKMNAVTMQGEIVLKYNDINKVKRINITELSESAVINAIVRLQNDNAKWIVFAQGYGMQTIEDESATGLSKLLVHLKKLGVHVARMPLNHTLNLADNVKAIVLPAPTATLDEEIVNWLKKQTQLGVSIWWLQDVTSAKQPNLELAFDSIIGEKTILKDTEYAAMMTEFPQHKITANFNQPIYLAEAVALSVNNAKTFMAAENGQPIAVSKQLLNSRFILTGDADFISNQYINAGANKSLTIRIIDWLFYHDTRINIPVKINQHTQLVLSTPQLLFLSIGWLIVIPILLLFIAFRQWRANRV